MPRPLLALSACSSSSDTTGTSTARDTSASPKLSGTVTVFAAASLKESFTALGKKFEDRHPGTKVSFNFGGSDTLAANITGGAPADVFAAASPTTMALVTGKEGTAGTPATFVRNRLEIATVPGNPHQVASLKDLTNSGLKVVLCDRTVPCGAAAQKALDAGRLKLTPVSYEQDVKGGADQGGAEGRPTRRWSTGPMCVRRVTRWRAWSSPRPPRRSTTTRSPC